MVRSVEAVFGGVADQPGAVWLDGGARGWGLYSWGPADVCTGGDWIGQARAWTRAGHLVIGFVGYDAAAGRDGDRRIPSVWLGRYPGAVWRRAGRWVAEGDSAFRAAAAARVASAKRLGSVPAIGPLPSLTWDEPKWARAVRAVQQRIAEGDCYQINLARPVIGPGSREAFGLWRRLRRETDAARGAFLRVNADTAILSASPERLLDVQGDVISSCPVKGTRPRGEGDAALAAALEASPKDRAELAMIVDLVRHDLGRVSKLGSVRVGPRCVVQHSTVWHAHQRVRARLAEGKDSWDALSSLLPAGSVTGAPKQRVIERIAELEGGPRGVSYGTVGWMTADAGAWSVAIRTAVVQPDASWFHVGGGITWGSDAAEEWVETRAKSRALARALLGVSEA